MEQRQPNQKPKTPSDKLAAYVNTGAAGAAEKTADRLMAALQSGIQWKRITIPGTNLEADLRAVTVGESIAVEIETIEALAKLPQTSLTQGEYEGRRAAGTLSRVVVDVTDRKPIGTVESWLALGVKALTEAWRIHSDHVEETDPATEGLTDEEIALVADAIEKKSAPLLRFLGSRVLSSWLTSTAGLHASYQSRSSTPTDSSPDSSSTIESPPEAP